MTTSVPLSPNRAQSYAEALKATGRSPFAFVGVTPHKGDHAPGSHGALGLAVANERGYYPVPMGWARYDSLQAANDHADHLNRLMGLDDEDAMLIIISTMGGMGYKPDALKVEG